MKSEKGMKKWKNEKEMKNDDGKQKRSKNDDGRIRE
jgi:hypothetical protein